MILPRLARTALLLTAVAPASADVRLPRILGDHMLLQRDLATPIWGWAEPGEEVAVSFAGQEHRVTADRHGRWRVDLAPLDASAEGRAMTIRGANELTLEDVLVGDVWLCSGQSNMEWPTRAVLDAENEVAQASHPALRLFDVPGHTTSPVPLDDVPGGEWRACTPESVANFSAVGYFFGRHVHRESGVPVGLVGTNWGGTRIEPWTPPVGFRAVNELASISEQVDRFDVTRPAGRATWEAYLAEVEAWIGSARGALETQGLLTPPPASPGYRGSGDPTAIYNAMVHGLAPYGVRGAIWYQGESNGGEGVEYHHKMRALIEGWRRVWGQGDFPLYFYFVQLADYQQPTEDPAGGDGWARLREAQRATLAVPHTGMAVITDVGQADDIHPRNKQDVGERLARWALRDVAGKDVVPSGPLYRAMDVEDGRVRLRFDHVGSGLMIGKKEGLEPTRRDEEGRLVRFAVAGEDRAWHWAEATIDGDTVLVSSPEVPHPVAVRYAYSMNPSGANLYNAEGLPASPFRTDAW